MAQVKPVPDSYPQVVPYLGIDGASDAIEFYKAVLGATERGRMGGPDGKIGHAELEIGRGMIMLADTNPQAGNKSPKDIGGTPVGIMVYVEDVDAVFDRAAGHDAEIIRKPEDQFYGDRMGTFRDPWGHIWYVASHVEDVSEEEMGRRMAAQSGT